MKPPSRARKKNIKYLINSNTPEREKIVSKFKSNEKYNCNICKKQFSTSSSFNHHTNLKINKIGLHIINISKFEKENHLIICSNKKCCFSTDNIYEFKNHTLENNHQIWSNSFLVAVKDNSHLNTTTCNTCQIKFTTKAALLNHTCKNSIVYRCEICINDKADFSKSYLSPDDLHQHILSTHKKSTEQSTWITSSIWHKDKKRLGKELTTFSTIPSCAPNVTMLTALLKENNKTLRSCLPTEAEEDLKKEVNILSLSLSLCLSLSLSHNYYPKNYKHNNSTSLTHYPLSS